MTTELTSELNTTTILKTSILHPLRGIYFNTMTQITYLTRTTIGSTNANALISLLPWISPTAQEKDQILQALSSSESTEPETSTSSTSIDSKQTKSPNTSTASSNSTKSGASKGSDVKSPSLKQSWFKTSKTTTSENTD